MGNRGDSFAEKWHSVYFFMPVFEKPVIMPELEDFCRAMNGKFGKVTTLADDAGMPQQAADMTSFVLWSHPVYYKKEERSVPSQLVLYGPDAFDKEQFDPMMIANFWACPNKEEFISRCNYSIMASNMVAAGLPVEEQYGIIADYADLILEMFPDCIGIYWPHSQNLVPREAFLQSSWRSKELHFLDGGLNVRFYNISGTDEMLFDTLGLTPIGIPDLQCHCKNLEPNEVVYFIRNLAAYLYQQGDVIEDGNTVEGIHHEKWRCQREDAMAGPMRVVLDIHMGEFAGGGRS